MVIYSMGEDINYFKWMCPLKGHTTSVYVNWQFVECDYGDRGGITLEEPDIIDSLPNFQEVGHYFIKIVQYNYSNQPFNATVVLVMGNERF